jgi:hypothetical protein
MVGVYDRDNGHLEVDRWFVSGNCSKLASSEHKQPVPCQARDIVLKGPLGLPDVRHPIVLDVASNVAIVLTELQELVGKIHCGRLYLAV